MNGVLDTIVWLANFPVTHGYAMVFIAGFSLFGTLGLAASRGASGARLDAVRVREGFADAPKAPTLRRVFARVRRIVFLFLSLVLAVGGVLGILGLVGVPVTRAYIHENGLPTTGRLDGEWVTFTNSSGVEYTLHNDFFTPSLYPDADAYIPTDQPVVVRYLPSHPQAFVIDTTQSTQ